MNKKIEAILKENSGIRLDIGCGASKQPGFVGLDMLPLPGVDIVTDIEKTPWDLPDNCVITAVASHILEHINPHGGDKRLQGLVDLLVYKNIFTQKEGTDWMGLPGPAFLNVMNEVWRVMKVGGQFAFVVPHAASQGFQQDPTHINMINETTMMYFDPLHPSGLYGFYRPKPWKLEQQYAQLNGNLEVVLVKRAWDKTYAGESGSTPSDIAHQDLQKNIEQVRRD